MNFFELHFMNLRGELVPFSRFKGKVCLVVNIASHCRFTPQLHDLETLYLFYKSRGFEILAFPSNDFGRQEPMNNEGILDFCRNEYVVTFTVFEKSHVRGMDANHVFRFLSDKELNGRIASRPWWNFHKYLVDRQGNVIDYFYTFTRPTSSRLMRIIEQNI